MVTTPGLTLLVEESVPDWMQRYHLRLLDELARVLAVDASNAQSVTLSNYANDTAAAAGGVQIGQLYRNGSIVQVRVT